MRLLLGLPCGASSSRYGERYIGYVARRLSTAETGIACPVGSGDGVMLYIISSEIKNQDRYKQ